MKMLSKTTERRRLSLLSSHAGYHGSDNHSSRRRIVRCGTKDRQGEAESMDIADWRQKIDELDEQIVALISRRAEAAKAIGDLKRDAEMPVYEPGREQAVFDHVKAVNSGPLDDRELLHIYERIIDVMRTLQRRDA
ncbi:MAG TPA: chorismate mutase [Acidobacteriaceae bacterium]|nr:chorismate mutase [Acidobacteriaceae bacterium]